MTHVLVGLGNPTEEYKATRHNTGRSFVEYFGKTNVIDTWEKNKKANATVTRGEYAGEKVVLILPDTFMNRSGNAVIAYVKSKKSAEKMIVVYDDLDLPLGSMKISFGRSSGGHRGIDSIVRTLKTKDFVRIRVGVSPTTPSGKLKKPKGEEAVVDFLMKPFRKQEQETLKKVRARVLEAISVLISEGRAVAMNRFN